MVVSFILVRTAYLTLTLYLFVLTTGERSLEEGALSGRLGTQQQ